MAEQTGAERSLSIIFTFAYSYLDDREEPVRKARRLAGVNHFQLASSDEITKVGGDHDRRDRVETCRRLLHQNAPSMILHEEY
jgi:hypothetical protein